MLHHSLCHRVHCFPVSFYVTDSFLVERCIIVQLFTFISSDHFLVVRCEMSGERFLSKEEVEKLSDAELDRYIEHLQRRNAEQDDDIISRVEGLCTSYERTANAEYNVLRLRQVIQEAQQSTSGIVTEKKEDVEEKKK